MLRADLIWVWPMLDWCIVILVGARLKASVWFPPFKRMYQRGTCKGCNNIGLFSLLQGHFGIEEKKFMIFFLY